MSVRTDGEGAAVGVVRLDEVDDGALLVGRDAAGHDGLADLLWMFGVFGCWVCVPNFVVETPHPKKKCTNQPTKPPNTRTHAHTHPRELEEAAAHPLLARQHERGPVDNQGARLTLLVPVLFPVVLFIAIYIFS